MGRLDKVHHTTATRRTGSEDSAPPFAVAIIILNYNTAQAVIDLYQQTTTLRQHCSTKTLYLVVDNASSPGDVSRLKGFFLHKPDVRLILNEANGGYARGNNLGLRRAAELGLQYCLIANSDIAFLTPDFLEQLIHAAQTLPDCGLIGPRVVLPDGRPQGPLPEANVFNSIFPSPSPRHERAEPVHATVGCCIFGPTEIFEQIGLFDEATFLYREENILAERLRQHNLLWYYLPQVVVRHDHVRKLESVRKILAHKKFEAQSTVYYFRHYKNLAAPAILTYRLLLAAKVTAFIAFSLLSRMAGRLIGRSLST